MDDRVYNINLDIRDKKDIEHIYLQQNDAGATVLNIKFYDGDKIYPLADTNQELIFIKKDLTSVLHTNIDEINPLTVSDDTIHCRLKQQVTTAIGRVNVEVVLRNLEGKRLTSQTFVMFIRKSLNTNEVIESTNDYNILDKLINTVTALLQEQELFNIAEIERVTNEDERERNEILRIKLFNEMELLQNNLIILKDNIEEMNLEELNTSLTILKRDLTTLKTTITNSINDANTSTLAANNAASLASSAVDVMILLADEVIAAEDLRVLSEQQRKDAESERVVSEQQRKDAETQRDNEFIQKINDFVVETERVEALYPQRLTKLEESKVKKYGVKFLGSNANGERLYDAIGMVANVAVDDEIVVNDFDHVSFFDRPICNVYFDTNGNPQVMAYRGEPGFSFEGGIFPPYAEKSDVYYECSPCAWNGSFDTPVVTGTPTEGFELFDCFPDWNTKIYLPSYFMGIEDGRPTSRSGVRPGYYSINTAFATAQAWNANAHGETINTHMYEFILQCIEFATRDLQTIMYGVGTLTYNSGVDVALVEETEVNRIILNKANNYIVGQTIVIGTNRNGDNVTGERNVTGIEYYNETSDSLFFDGEPVNIGIGNFVSSRGYKNGATDIVVASSGSPVSNTSGKYPCIWRGKVDPWGSGYSGICNSLTKRYGAGTSENPYIYKLCYLRDPKKYANGVITDDYIELNYNMPAVDGHVKKLGQDARFPLIGLTEEIGAGSTTYYSDYYYFPRYDIGAVFVGGDFSGGRLGGPLFFYCNVSPAYVNIYRLARLFVTPL